MENWIEPEVVFFTKKGKFRRTCTSFPNAFFFPFQSLEFLSCQPVRIKSASVTVRRFKLTWSSSRDAAPCDSFNMKTLLKPRQVSSSMQFNFGQMFCTYSFIPAQCKNKIHTWTLTSVRQFHLKEAIWSLRKGVSKLRKTDIVITLKSGNDKKFENVLALGRWGFIKSPPKPQNLPPSSFFFRRDV